MFGDQSLELRCVLVEVAEGSRASRVIYYYVIKLLRNGGRKIIILFELFTVFAAIFFAEIVGLHGEKVVGAFGGGGRTGAGHNGDQDKQEIGND